MAGPIGKSLPSAERNVKNFDLKTAMAPNPATTEVRKRSFSNAGNICVGYLRSTAKADSESTPLRTRYASPKAVLAASTGSSRYRDRISERPTSNPNRNVAKAQPLSVFQAAKGLVCPIQMPKAVTPATAKRIKNPAPSLWVNFI